MIAFMKLENLLRAYKDYFKNLDDNKLFSPTILGEPLKGEIHVELV